MLAIRFHRWCNKAVDALPSELVEIAGELSAYHLRFPDDTARVGYCFDISNGYIDKDRVQRHSTIELLKTALPHVTELHLKNTNSLLESTFGFTLEDKTRGIVDAASVRDYLLTHADVLPRALIGLPRDRRAQAGARLHRPGTRPPASPSHSVSSGAVCYPVLTACRFRRNSTRDMPRCSDFGSGLAAAPACTGYP